MGRTRSVMHHVLRPKGGARKILICFTADLTGSGVSPRKESSSMRRTPLRIAGLCAIAATMTASVAACGNDDKKAACDKLQDTITQVSQSGMAQNDDPNGLAHTYYSNATTLRQE